MDKYVWFVGKFRELTGIDLSAYKRAQMERRINNFMQTQGVYSYEQFVRVLAENSSLREKFIDHLTINVSEFFRNPAQWTILQEEIIPALLKRGEGKIRAWSAGCSTGEEAYTLAMVLLQKAPQNFERILATDIDPRVLEKARQGVYSAKSVAGVPPHLLKKYFICRGEFYEANEELKRQIIFKQHDLLRDPFPHRCDLILCRNVVIYFTEDAKISLYQRFSNTLTKGGILFIGSTEQIFQARELGLKPVATFFYQKI